MSLAQLAQLKCRQSNVNPIIIRGWILRQPTQISLIPCKANPSPFCQSRVKSLPISSQSEDNCTHNLGTSLLYGSTTGLDGGQFCARGLDQWNSNRTTPLPIQCCSTNTQPNHQYTATITPMNLRQLHRYFRTIYNLAFLWQCLEGGSIHEMPLQHQSFFHSASLPST